MISNIDEPAVIAQILTAPPRGGGPGGGPGAAAQAPPASPPAGGPPAAAPPAATPPSAPPATPGAVPADPGAGRQGGGRGGGTPPHAGPANWIKISAKADGSFTVTNSRNSFSRTYSAK